MSLDRIETRENGGSGHKKRLSLKILINVKTPAFISGVDCELYENADATDPPMKKARNVIHPQVKRIRLNLICRISGESEDNSKRPRQKKFCAFVFYETSLFKFFFGEVWITATRKKSVITRM